MNKTTISIRTRLALLTSGSAVAVLLFACVGFAVNGIHQLRQAKARHLVDQAKMVAFHSPPVLTLRSKDAGSRVLAFLHSDETVEFACIFNERQQVIAAYGMNSAPSVSPELIPGGYRFIGLGHLEVTQPIIIAGRGIGGVLIRANTSDLQQQILQRSCISGCVLALALVVAVWLPLRLQRGISQSISALAHAAERVAFANDYSIRVQPDAKAELLTLQTHFNRIVERLRKAEHDVEQSQAELESRVTARTQEVTRELVNRKRVQAELESAKALAESASQAKSDFLANMSHEIRTPLNGILGFTDLLLRDDSACTAEERRDYLQTIRRSGHHTLELINGLLDLAKIESGRLELERVPFSLHEVVSEVIAALRTRAQEKGLFLSCEWSSGLPDRIEGDPVRMRQLLLNLVGNAVKFTQSGGVRVIVGITSATVPQLNIDVVDTGIGIAADSLEKVFEPFKQADASVTRLYGGTGLGLAISRRIVTAMRGTLSVDSTPGHGSRFSVVLDPGNLRNTRILSSPPPTGQEPTPPIHEVETPLRGTILIVDDGETNRKLVRLLLQRAGFKVVAAASGLEALQLVDKQPFDLILMDMQMPGLDGYRTTQRLREQGCKVVIVALTAHAMPGDEARCKAAGCSGYIAKPIDSDRFLAAIRSYLMHASRPPIYSTLPMDDMELRDIVQEFLDQLRDNLVRMQLAFEHRRLEDLVHFAHWLKGAGGSAGFSILFDAARKLEVMARTNRLDEAGSVLDQITDVCSRMSLPEVVAVDSLS